LSSILKALQRLESESREKGAGAAWLQNLNAKRNWGGAQAHPRRKVLLAFLGGGILLCGIAVLHVKNHDRKSLALSSSGPHASKAVVDSGTQSNVLPVEKKDLPALGVAPRVAPGPLPDAENGNGAKASAQKNAAVVPPHGDPPKAKPAGRTVLPQVAKPAKQTVAPLEAKPAERTAASPEAKPAGRTIAPSEAKPAGRTVAPPIAVNTEKPRIETVLRNTGLTLHAISWTPDVKSRIAVINGSIVREGDRLNGYQVHRINQDDIELDQNGTLGKLVFDSR